MAARNAIVRRLCAALLLSVTGMAVGACELLTSVDYTNVEADPCPEGLSLCNDGTCLDLQVNQQHCGACGRACAFGSTCRDGQCVCNDPSATLCTLGCVILQIDPANCGACGKQCPTLYCSNGQCDTSCVLPRVMCGSVCVDPSSDEQNCGTCGRRCFGACHSGLCISEPADAAFDVAVDSDTDGANGGNDAADAQASTDASDAGGRRDAGRP